MQHRKQSTTPRLPRLRGFRIRSQMEGQDWMGNETRTLWVAEPALPDEWEQTKKNPRIIRALLIRSGRRYATYERSAR
jgi:hypothetical protein